MELFRKFIRFGRLTLPLIAQHLNGNIAATVLGHPNAHGGSAVSKHLKREHIKINSRVVGALNDLHFYYAQGN